MDILRFLPYDEYQGATNSPTQATQANPFVTVADLPAASGDGIYDGNGTVPSSTTATLTDRFTFSGAGAIGNGIGMVLINNLDAATNFSYALKVQNSGATANENVGIHIDVSGSAGANYGLRVEDGSEGTANYVLASVDTQGRAQWVDPNTLVNDNSGIYGASGTVPTSVIATLTDTIEFIDDVSTRKIILGQTTELLDIELEAGSVNPLGMYENRVGGANIGDNYAIDFHFNDSAGAKTLGGSITVRVDNAPSPGDVEMSLTLIERLKVQPNDRVYIGQNAVTDAAVAHLEIDGTGVSSNTIEAVAVPTPTLSNPASTYNKLTSVAPLALKSPVAN